MFSTNNMVFGRFRQSDLKCQHPEDTTCLQIITEKIRFWFLIFTLDPFRMYPLGSILASVFLG